MNYEHNILTITYWDVTGNKDGVSDDGGAIINSEASATIHIKGVVSAMYPVVHNKGTHSAYQSKYQLLSQVLNHHMQPLFSIMTHFSLFRMRLGHSKPGCPSIMNQLPSV